MGKEEILERVNEKNKIARLNCITNKIENTDVIAKDPETGIYIVPITALRP